MINKPDVLEILGISSREDSFTNIMEYLFNSSARFKLEFCKKFLNIKDSDDLSDITLLNRRSYKSKINQRIIPDMILYSHKLNRISIIEVKVHSGQGKNQLERYSDNINIIIDKLKLEAKERAYYYLSIEDDSNNLNGWEYVNWEDMYDIFDITSQRDDINFIIDAIKARINSLKLKLNYKDVKL